MSQLHLYLCVPQTASTQLGSVGYKYMAHKQQSIMAAGEQIRSLVVDRDDIDWELRDIDVEILELLEEGRCTRQHLADELDVTGEYVYQRIDPLIQLGVVHKIHDGFYELEDEYREE